LLPRGQEGKSVTVLTDGFEQSFSMDVPTILTVATLISMMVILMVHMHNQQMTNAYQMEMALAERIAGIKLSGLPGPMPGHMDSPGLPGQDGQDGKDCTQAHMLHANLKTDFPVFALPEDIGSNAKKNIPTTTDALRPGQELKSGESMKIGGFSLSVRGCYFFIRLSGSGEDTPVITSHGPKYDRLNGPCTLSMQRDGNLVMYHPEGAVWALRDSELKKTCPFGITVNEHGALECVSSTATAIAIEDTPMIYTTNFVPPGQFIRGEARFRLGDYQLGLRECDIVMFSLFHSKADRTIVKRIGTDCSLEMREDGNLVLSHPERGSLWASTDTGMPACFKGMTVNKEGFLNCVK
jgi:hypothetical protein